MSQQLAEFALSDWDAPEGVEDEKQVPTVLTFTLGDQLFAVDVQRVREILDMTEISPLPSAPHDVLGIIDLRGQAIAIVDLAARIGARHVNNDGARIIVFEFPTDAAEPVSLGVLADKVLRVREMPEDSTEPVPTTMSDWNCEVATGMLRTEDGLAMVLGIDSILCQTARPGPFDFS